MNGGTQWTVNQEIEAWARAMEAIDETSEDAAFLREIGPLEKTGRGGISLARKAVEDNPWFLLRAAALRARIENDPAMAPVMDYLNCYIDAAGMRDSWNAGTETFREICEGLEDRDAFLSAIGRIEASAAYSEENPGTPAARWLTRYAEEAGLSRYFEFAGRPDNKPVASGLSIMQDRAALSTSALQAMYGDDIRIAATFMRDMTLFLKCAQPDKTHIVGAVHTAAEYFLRKWGKDALEEEMAWIGKAEKASKAFDHSDATLVNIYKAPKYECPEYTSTNHVLAFRAAVFLRKLDAALLGRDQKAAAAAEAVAPYMIRVLDAMPPEWKDEVVAWAPAVTAYTDLAQTLAPLMGDGEKDERGVLDDLPWPGAMKMQAILAEEARAELTQTQAPVSGEGGKDALSSSWQDVMMRQAMQAVTERESRISRSQAAALDSLKDMCLIFMEAGGGLEETDPEWEMSIRASVAARRVARAHLPELGSVQETLEKYITQVPLGMRYKPVPAPEFEKLYMAMEDALRSDRHTELLKSSLILCRTVMENAMTEENRAAITGMRSLSQAKAAPKGGMAP